MEIEKTVNFPEPEKSAGIVIDDGMEEVHITNKFGKPVGVFYIRPTDLGMRDRYDEMMKDFDSVFAPIEDASINSDGTAKDERSEVALKEAKKRLSEKLDFLFDGNFSDAFFGKMHPFSIVGGRFYCENAIEAVGADIGKSMDRETKLVQNRVDKYTHGYRTGKHRNGKRRRGPQQ